MCEPTTIDITQKPVRLINLNDCKPGQMLKDRNGNIYIYEWRINGDDIHTIIDHWQDSCVRWSNGRANKDIAQNRDIVEIIPLKPEKPEKPMVINLNDCKPGQKLRRRDGKIVAYRSKNKGNVGNTYSHIVDHNKDTHGTHTDTGLVFVSSTNPPDIVEILPLEPEKKVIDLNDCKPGQKLRTREGVVYMYDKPSRIRDVHHINIVDATPQFNTCRFSDGRSSWHSRSDDIVEILPLEFKESKVEEEIPILTKVSIIDEVEFQMWDCARQEYYGVVTSAFARKLEDSNRKLITENDWLLNRIKQMEEENKRLEEKCVLLDSECSRHINTKLDQLIKIQGLEGQLDLFKGVYKLVDIENALIAGWRIEEQGDYKGTWVSPEDGMHYKFEQVLKRLKSLKV